MRRAAVSKACDGCRRRKVKCSLSHPCAPCQDAGLQCTFLTIRQRKGRKGASAHVINEIRNSQQTSSLEEAESSPNPLPPHATSNIAGRLLQRSADDDIRQTLDSFSEDLHDIAHAERPLNSFPFPFDSLNYTSPTFSLLPDTHTSPQQDNLPTKRFARTQSLLQPRVIDVCAEFFLSELSSTVPIVTPDIIRQATAAAANDDEAYCFCCSFCAFVLLQTDELSRDQLIQAGIHQEPRVYGQTLLTEALSARGHLDLLASIPSLRTVFLTFFIYGCHSALGKHRQAWYFLREATTFYTTATMDLAEEDIDEAFHRLFWLLLVSERRRPITLQITPQCPRLEDLARNSPHLVGFRCLAELFKPIDDYFISLWNRASTNCSAHFLVESEQNIRRGVATSLDIVDTQLANIRVSQQWLRVIVWQLCTMLGYLSSDAAHESLTFRYPLKIAQDLAISTWKLPLHSMQMHGIGLTEKVFDITCTLIDVISCIPTEDVKSNGFETGPEDNLKHFFSLIARLPGGRDKYLPLLVTKVDQMLPAMTVPLARHIHVPLNKQAPTYIELEKGRDCEATVSDPNNGRDTQPHR
ncbi:hypothetical protein LTS15_010905 [Exophiala xenobiotica]|nr:hypothetical protein LTS15_010905 [Exophiala xenobiotica]